MRVLGYSTEWDAEAGLVGVGLSDVQLYCSAEEFEALAAFFHECASRLRSGRELPGSACFGNDDQAATTGVSFMAFPR